MSANITFNIRDEIIKCTALSQGARNPMPLGERPEAGVAKRLRALGSPATGILPPGVRWISATGRQVLFERPPRRMRVEYSPKQAGHADPKWRDVEISLPWQIYAMVFSNEYQLRSLTLYASQRQITSSADYLGLMPMPNTHDGGNFCLPGNPPVANNLADAIQNAYQMMWHSKFNMDVWDVMAVSLRSGRPSLLVDGPTEATAPKGSRLLRRWEELSQEQVLSINDWPSMTTVAQVINELRQYAASSFTGWHLMTTAKQAFNSAPAKDGEPPRDSFGKTAEERGFDAAIEFEAMRVRVHQQAEPILVQMPEDPVPEHAHAIRAVDNAVVPNDFYVNVANDLNMAVAGDLVAMDVAEPEIRVLEYPRLDPDIEVGFGGWAERDMPENLPNPAPVPPQNLAEFIDYDPDPGDDDVPF